MVTCSTNARFSQLNSHWLDGTDCCQQRTTMATNDDEEYEENRNTKIVFSIKGVKFPVCHSRQTSSVMYLSRSSCLSLLFLHVNSISKGATTSPTTASNGRKKKVSHVHAAHVAHAHAHASTLLYFCYCSTGPAACHCVGNWVKQCRITNPQWGIERCQVQSGAPNPAFRPRFVETRLSEAGKLEIVFLAGWQKTRCFPSFFPFPFFFIHFTPAQGTKQPSKPVERQWQIYVTADLPNNLVGLLAWTGTKKKNSSQQTLGRRTQEFQLHRDS